MRNRSNGQMVQCMSDLPVVPHQDILGPEETSHVLQNLDTDTEYTVTVTAIYPDESESEDLMGDERTCKNHAALAADP